MGYVEYDYPLGKNKAPFNILIIWCKGCGTILDGNGDPQPHKLKIHQI